MLVCSQPVSELAASATAAKPARYNVYYEKAVLSLDAVCYLFIARCSAKCGSTMVSYCPSVCPFVTLECLDHTVLNFLKVIKRTISPESS